MKRNRTPWRFVLILIGLLLLASGCGQSEDTPDQQLGEERPTFSDEPVVVTLFNQAAGIVTDLEMETLLIKPVQEKYPNIMFERITGITLEQMITAGEVPDLIGTSNVHLLSLLDLGLAGDLNPIIQRDKIDLSKLEPGALEVLRNFGQNGEMYGMPFAMNYGLMVYNADIFDALGVPYPTDNMTWEQTIALARRVTQTHDGVQYIGLDMGGVPDLTRAYSLPTVGTNGKALVGELPGYRKVFDLYHSLYSIPGIVTENNKFRYGIDFFLKDQQLAMFPYWVAALTARIPPIIEAGQNFNWDLVTWPTFDDKPGIGRQFDFHLMTVPSTSRNKEAAYRVLEVLISEDAQRTMNRGTRLTILQDPEIKQEFASDLGIYEGKNLAGIFKVTPAPYELATPYDSQINSILNDVMRKIVVDGIDVNTALREADERANQAIEAIDKQ